MVRGSGGHWDYLILLALPLLFVSLAFAVTVTQPPVTSHSGNNYSLELLGTIADSTVRSFQTTNWTCLVTQCNFSLIVDADTFNFSGFLGFSDFNVSSVLYRFGNAWRNASELKAIGQGDFSVNGTHVSLGLAGSDGFDFGVRDNQEGGSYWHDENGLLYGKINISNDFISVALRENETMVYNSSGGRIFNYTFNDAVRVDNRDFISTYGTGTQNKTVYFWDWANRRWAKWGKGTGCGTNIDNGDGTCTLNVSATVYQANSVTGTGVSCPPFNSISTNGFRIQKDASSSSTFPCNAMAPVFDISSIPDTAKITDAILFFNVTASTNPISCSYRRMDSSPAYYKGVNDTEGFFSDVNNGTEFLSNDPACAGNGQKTIYLSQASQDIESRLSEANWSFGLTFYNFTRDGSVHAIDMSGIHARIVYEPLRTPDWNDPRNKQSFKWMYAFQKSGMNLTGLKAYYRFDEPNGNLINFAGAIGSADSLGTTVDGINTNMNVSSPGKLGNSYYYSENASSGTQLGYSKSQLNFMHNNSSVFTFAFWYKAPVSHDFAGGRWIFSTSNQDVNCIGVGFNIYWQNNGLNLVIENGTAGSGTCTPVSATSSAYLPDTNWHFYTVSYDINLPSNNVRMTRDGGNPQTFSRTGYGNNTDATYFPTVGRRNATVPSLEGQLDEISIWNRVLTDSDILALYNNGTGMGVGDLDKPKINITYSMTAHDPFVRTFVDTLSPQWLQNNISIPISLGENKSSTSYHPNKTGSYFITSGNTLEQVWFAAQNFKNSTHAFNYTVPSITQIRYDYIFNSTMNQNFLFSLGTGGTINTTGFNPQINATQFSSETIESVANSTLTYYDLDDSSLVGWWRFNEGSGNQTKDSSGNGNNGTLGNASAGTQPAWISNSSCKYGGCMYFDGTQSHINMTGNTGRIKSPLPLTVSAWINVPTGAGGTKTIIATDDAPTYRGLLFQISGSSPMILFGSGATQDSTSRRDKTAADPIRRDVWVHVVAVVRGPTDMDIYINGTNAGGTYSGTGGGISYSGNSSVIGIYFNSQFFNGTMDTVKLYSRALSAEEIKAEYYSTKDSYPSYGKSEIGGGAESTFTPFYYYDGGASGIWKFDEGSGTNVTDASSNDVIGRLNGSVTWISNSSCRYGGCLKFSSTGYNRIVFSNPVITGQDFALSVWIKGHQTGSATYIQGNYGTGNTNGVQLGLSSGNAPVICITNGYCLTSPTTITDMTKWYYIVATRSSGVVKIHVDDIMVKEGTSNLSIAGSLNWSIGNGPDFATEPVNGILDDVRAYPRALSESEIRSHYQRSVSKYYNDFSVGPKRYFGVEDSNMTLQPTTPAGTVLHLRFNDNSTVNVTDISGNGIVGRNVNNALWLTNSSCKDSFDGCMLLSEGNDYVNLGDNLDMGNSSFTVSTWFNKKNSSTDQMKIINKGRAGAGTPPEAGYNLITTSGVIEFNIADANEVNRYRVNTTEPSINEWHHAAGILDRGSSEIRLYVDGIHINTTSIGSLGSLDTNLNLAIGALTRNDIGATDTFFDGAVDEVIIVNRSLSSEEVYQLYLGGVQRHAGDLIGWWKFNENRGNFTMDSSGSGNTGNMANMNTLGNATSGWNATDCKYGSCLKFDGINDYIKVENERNFDFKKTDPFSVCLWLSTTVSGVQDSLMFKENALGSDPGWQIVLDTTNDIVLRISNGSAGFGVDTVATVNNGNWQHFCGSYDGSADRGGLRVYINGSLDNTGTPSAIGGEITNNLNLVLGAESDGGNTFNGSLDNVKIWKRALTASEIQNEYRQNHDLYSQHHSIHRVVSADDLQSVSFNVTDHDLSTQRDYDQRELLFIGIQSIDAPRWSNATNTSSGQTYPGTHQFNVTWIANGTINASMIEHNFTGSFANYSVQNQSSVYYYFTDMPAGTFAYRFLANDSLGQWNATPQLIYIVNKAMPTLSIFLNGTLSNRTYNYPDAVNATATESNAGDADITYTIYRNATNITSGSLSRIEPLANATHNFTINASGGQNYSTVLAFATAQVNKGILALSLSGANVTYPTAVSVTPGEGNAGDADVNYTLWRNTSIFSTSNGSAPSSDTAQLAAYAYLYVLNATSGQNWTANATGINLTIVVSKGATNSTLFLNGTRANYTIEFGNIANITAAINVTSNISLYTSFGGFLGNASQSLTNLTNASNLALGAHQITANFSGDENYTASSEQWYLNVTNFAPIILSVSAGSVGTASATITWSTNEASNSTVYYGTTQAASSNTSNSSLVTSHSVPLSLLTASTLYYFNVSSCDVFGACNSSSQYNFTTSAAATTTTTTAGSSGGGGGGGSAAATTTTSTTTTITQTTTTTLQGATTTTIREATKDNVAEDLKKVENAILRADALKVNVDRAKELLSQAYRAYDQGDFVLAQAIAEQAFNEALAKVEEKNKEPSVSIFLMVGVVAGLVGIIVVYLKRDSVSPAIETAKVAFSGLSGRISESASSIRASLKKKSPPLKGEGPFGANIAEILEDPERFAGKGVIIANCKLIEITGGEYVLEDVTGTVPGYSDQIGLQGTGTVEGKVIYSEGRLYIEF